MEQCESAAEHLYLEFNKIMINKKPLSNSGSGFLFINLICLRGFEARGLPDVALVAGGRVSVGMVAYPD